MSHQHSDILLAGALAAFSVDLIVYPLDTIKTRFQSRDYKKLYWDASKNAINRKLLFSGLYHGIGSVILITIPSSGAFFTVYEGLNHLLANANPRFEGSGAPLMPVPFVHGAASATAELVSCLILTPAEVLKQNAQMIQRRPNDGHRPVTMEALKQFKSPFSLWRGYTALAARNLPFTAIQFPVFEHLRLMILDERRKSNNFTGSLLETAMTTAISAASAGSIAAWITTPIDVIKTRIMLSASEELQESKETTKMHNDKRQAQLLGGKSYRDTNNTTRKSNIDVLHEIRSECGIRGLFRGAILRSVWTAVGSGLYLGAYESGKAVLERRRENE